MVNVVIVIDLKFRYSLVNKKSQCHAESHNAVLKVTMPY